MRIIVEVPDDKESLVFALMQELGYPASRVAEPTVPAWHKEEVRHIRAQTKPEDYIPLDDFLKEWESE